MVKKSEIAYSVKSNIGSYETYGMLEIDVYVKCDWPAYKRVGTITFQSNHREQDAEWYGGHIDIDAESIEDLQAKTAALKAFVGDIDFRYNFPALRARIESLTRVVYDDRINEWVAISDVKPSDYTVYYDNYRDNGYCTVRAWARDEYEARRNLMLKFVQESNETCMVAWIDAGKPIRRSYDRAPKVADLEEVFKAQW